jgi:hypothetical protein
VAPVVDQRGAQLAVLALDAQDPHRRVDRTVREAAVHADRVDAALAGHEAGPFEAADRGAQRADDLARQQVDQGGVGAAAGQQPARAAVGVGAGDQDALGRDPPLGRGRAHAGDDRLVDPDHVHCHDGGPAPPVVEDERVGVEVVVDSDRGAGSVAVALELDSDRGGDDDLGGAGAPAAHWTSAPTTLRIAAMTSATSWSV